MDGLIDSIIAFLMDFKTLGPAAKIGALAGLVGLGAILWAIVRSLGKSKLRNLITKHDELVAEISERDEIIKEVARPLGNLVIETHADADSSAQLQAQISYSVSMNNTLQNNGINEVLRALDEIRGKISGEEAEAIRKAAEDAKKEDDLAKKVEKVAKVIDAFGKVAETVSDLVPYGRTAFRILRGVFS